MDGTLVDAKSIWPSQLTSTFVCCSVQYTHSRTKTSQNSKRQSNKSIIYDKIPEWAAFLGILQRDYSHETPSLNL